MSASRSARLVRGFADIRERFFHTVALTVAAGERWVRGNKESVLVLFDDDWEVAGVAHALHMRAV